MKEKGLRHDHFENRLISYLKKQRVYIEEEMRKTVVGDEAEEEEALQLGR